MAKDTRTFNNNGDKKETTRKTQVKHDKAFISGIVVAPFVPLQLHAWSPSYTNRSSVGSSSRQSECYTHLIILTMWPNDKFA